MTSMPRLMPILARCATIPPSRRVYIATPHQFHAAHARLAAAACKHIILEKPMALTLADCDAIMAAAAQAGVRLIIGHTHAFDPPIRKMRAMIASGELGRLGMVASWNYTNYLYRPRRPEELDTAQGGGILFNQVPHQIDVVRLLGGGLVKSVRAAAGSLDPARPTEGHAVAFLAFADGVAASLVYGGYDFFDSDEWHEWISERGRPKRPAHGEARRALAASRRDETALRIADFAYGGPDAGEPPHQPHFGLTVATCARGELRGSADGVLLYGEDGRREIALDDGPRFTGRGNVLDDLWAAIRQGKKPLHDGRWGKATVEVALAIQASARQGQEIELQHQVPAAP